MRPGCYNFLLPQAVRSPLQQIVVLAHRRRAAVLIAAAMLAVLCLFGAARLSFDANVLQLLPRSATGKPHSPSW